ncbi:hypothetical protein GCM10009599_17010 [Luteococcus peritonei]
MNRTTRRTLGGLAAGAVLATTVAGAASAAPRPTAPEKPRTSATQHQAAHRQTAQQRGQTVQHRAGKVTKARTAKATTKARTTTKATTKSRNATAAQTRPATRPATSTRAASAPVVRTTGQTTRTTTWSSSRSTATTGTAPSLVDRFLGAGQAACVTV